MTTEGGRRGFTALLFDVRVLRVASQVAAIVFLVGIAAYLSDNYQANSRGRAGGGGWDFLDEPIGFNIAFADGATSGIPVREALWIGVENTLKCAVVGMVLSTLIGVIVGVLRLSRSWVARKVATFYVEVLRNVPVLLIILFVAASLRTLPQIDEHVSLGSLLAISNREIVILSPVAGDGMLAYLGLLAVAGLAALAVSRWRTRVSDATGEPAHRWVWAGGPFLVVAALGYFLLDGPLTWSRPEFEGRGVLGGASLNMPYVAMTGALALYHGSHIAEIVRGSIQAVPPGQNEAATAVGLSDFQRLRFVVLPQAFRIAIPPTINQHLSLTKNTSLGIAVAYSDVASLGYRLIGASRAPALQMILVLMAIYLTLSLVTSALLNMVNRRLQLVER